MRRPTSLLWQFQQVFYEQTKWLFQKINFCSSEEWALFGEEFWLFLTKSFSSSWRRTLCSCGRRESTQLWERRFCSCIRRASALLWTEFRIIYEQSFLSSGRRAVALLGAELLLFLVKSICSSQRRAPALLRKDLFVFLEKTHGGQFPSL